MNKEQSADDPSVDLIRKKYAWLAPFLYELIDVVIACIEQGVPEVSRAIEAALKHDNNMKDYFGG